MAPQKRKAETYDKSDYFVADDDEDETTSKPTSKRAKATTSNADNDTEIPSMKKDDEGNEYWEISKARRVGLSDFKGKRMVSIREYYEKDSKWLPGKKGITMTLEQFSTFVTLLPQIETALTKKGVKLPRPHYDGSGPVQSTGDDDDEDEDEGVSDEGNGRRKANIEATSDEDED